MSRFSAIVLGAILVSATTTAALPLTEKGPAQSPQSKSSSPPNGTPGNPDSAGTDNQPVNKAAIGPSFEDVCGVAPAIRPGQNAGWAAEGLAGLYFEPGLGFGAVEAGCPEPKEEVRDAVDDVVFQRGLKENGLRSVALMSHKFGAAMFLDQAAVVVLGYLTNGVAASGTQRVDVGNGDVQLIWTREGTTTLIRGRKVRT